MSNKIVKYPSIYGVEKAGLLASNPFKSTRFWIEDENPYDTSSIFYEDILKQETEIAFLQFLIQNLSVRVINSYILREALGVFMDLDNTFYSESVKIPYLKSCSIIMKDSSVSEIKIVFRNKQEMSIITNLALDYLRDTNKQNLGLLDGEGILEISISPKDYYFNEIVFNYKMYKTIEFI